MTTKSTKVSMSGLNDLKVFKETIRAVDATDDSLGKGVSNISETFDEPLVANLIPSREFTPHVISELCVNEVNQKTIFSDNIFTVNADRLMFNYKHFNNPFDDIDEYIKLMNQLKPFNITKWKPNTGQFVILGIANISPLVLSGVSKVEGRDIMKYASPFTYFVVGVFHEQTNDKFGMKVVYEPTKDSITVGQQEDPISGRNLREFYTDASIKKDILANKDLAAINRVPTRMLLLVDEMEIKGYTY